MSKGDAQNASGIVTYRTVRELGSRSPRSYAAVREPSELVVIHRFSRSTDPRAKSTASFVAADGGITVGSEALANLARDARCLAKNWHPNIARVRHVDLAGDELTVATELVDGTTLGDLLEAAKRARGARVAVDEPLLPLPVLVRILVDVVTGLSGLHGLRDANGLPLATIHGALSPANIVVGKDGVARLINALRPRPLRTAAGTEAVGYAAPEALDLGAMQDVRADLHSVGVIMWEALTGRRLYAETDPARVLARQREEDVPPPAFPSGSPFARLAEVTRQAMAFEAGLRFKTAAELGAALRNIAATRIATGSVVATRVAELGGERVRARRLELDPGATGKHRLPSDRALRAAKPAAPAARAPAPAPAAAAGTERETLPPVSMDASDLDPESERSLDVSVRDFLAGGEAPSAPALAPVAAPAPSAAAPPPPAVAPPAPKQTLIGHAAPAAPPAASVEKGSTEKGIGRSAPPLLRKTAAAASPPPASSPALKASPPPASSPALKASPPPVQAAPVVVEAPPAFVAAPVAAFDDVPRPAAPAPQPGYAPRAADAPVVHSTPDAFTPAHASPPPTRRTLVGVLLGCAAALLIVVGFFAVRSLVGGAETTTTTATVAPSSEASATPNPPASVKPEADEPKDEAKPETPPAESATAAAAASATETAPAETAEPPSSATPAAAEAATAAAAPVGVVRGPADGQGAPSAGAKPPASSPPKKRTYEPLGI